MKILNTAEYSEKLKIRPVDAKNLTVHKYFPSSNGQLHELLIELITERGPECDLNDICTTNIKTMNMLFTNSKILQSFNGDISLWDVSNVTTMSYMFYKSKFNGNISKWNVSNVELMYCMFSDALYFNCDISDWNVSKVVNMQFMFDNAPNFNQDLSSWNVGKNVKHEGMFQNCPMFKMRKKQPIFNK